MTVVSEHPERFTWPGVIARLVRGEDLDAATAEAALAAVMQGEATGAQLGGLLIALRAKGETTAEVAGLVRAMRAAALTVPLADGPDPVDTCGTGGDRAGTFNVSTLAAVVAAAAGARVAKHGNRAASGRCGSADLLEDWGIVIDLPPEGVARCVDEVGIGFCFAPVFHPAMRHVMPTRRELGVPTVFNFLGPLTNPAGVRHQTIGVSDPTMAPRMASALAALDTVHALVFHGHGGLDELTTTGPSHVWEVRRGAVEEWELDPASLGLAPATLADLQGGGVAENRVIADAVLAGAQGAPREIVLLGAAAALVAADLVADFPSGLERSSRAIDDGSAAGLVERWVEVSRRAAPG